MNKKNTQPLRTKGIIKNSTFKVKRILSNSMRELINMIKKLFSFLPKRPKENGEDEKETKKDTKRSKETNNGSNPNKENKSNFNNGLNENKNNSSQNENKEQQQSATQQQGDSKQPHKNESGQTNNNQEQNNNNIKQEQSSSNEQNDLNKENSSNKQSSSAKQNNLNNKNSSIEQNDINNQNSDNKPTNSIVPNQNSHDEQSNELDSFKNALNAQPSNETKQSEVTPNYTEQNQSEFDKIKEGLQQLKSNSKGNCTEEEQKSNDLQKQGNQTQSINNNSNVGDEINSQRINQGNQEESHSINHSQDVVNAEIIDQTHNDRGQYGVQLASGQTAQNVQDNTTNFKTINAAVNKLHNDENRFEEKAIESAEENKNDENKTLLGMLESILPNFSGEQVPFGDLEQDNEKVNELIVNTIIKKFIRMRFKSQKSQLNTRQSATEKVSGVSKWDTMQVVKHKTTKEYNKMLKDKYDYDYDSGKQEQIPLSIYIDMSPSMNCYIPVLTTLAMQLLKNDVRVIIGTNEIAKMQINSVSSSMTKDEFTNLMKSRKSIDKNTKFNFIDCEISKYLIDKKAEKVLVFSDYDPVRSICALANSKCQVYWFNFDGIRKSYLKNYKGVICEVSKTDDILKALTSFTDHNYNYLTYKKREVEMNLENKEDEANNLNYEDFTL